ncbi:unnamed protein product, partial [Discosporangium mesarthrocarpum]
PLIRQGGWSSVDLQHGRKFSVLVREGACEACVRGWMRSLPPSVGRRRAITVVCETTGAAGGEAEGPAAEKRLEFDVGRRIGFIKEEVAKILARFSREGTEERGTAMSRMVKAAKGFIATRSRSHWANLLMGMYIIATKSGPLLRGSPKVTNTPGGIGILREVHGNLHAPLDQPSHLYPVEDNEGKVGVRRSPQSFTGEQGVWGDDSPRSSQGENTPPPSLKQETAQPTPQQLPSPNTPAALPSDASPVTTSDMRTHTDLGDLELAAEGALNFEASEQPAGATGGGAAQSEGGLGRGSAATSRGVVSVGPGVTRGEVEEAATAPAPPFPGFRAGLGSGLGGGQGGTAGGQSSSFVAAAARAVSPAVCRIDMERIVSTFDDSPFPDVEVGQGSGVIFSSEDGLVLTNAHVVSGADKVTITLTDGRKFLAEVKGADELSDLAVLRILNEGTVDTTPLPSAKLGDSQHLQVGDWVIAVGNPVGLDSTVTLGIVSSLKRSSQEVGFPNRKVTFIQTDAAINPGNSGGPLVNEYGEVVGINTAIRAHAEGIGFAIPINKAKAIMYELAEGKRIEYAYVGIHMTTITPDFAHQNNRDPNSNQLIPEVDGAMIVRVLPGTPAADAGLRRHDVVIEMGGRRVRTADDAKMVVDESGVGEIIAVKVMRGVEKIVELEVRARDLTEQLGMKNSPSPPPGRGPSHKGPGGYGSPRERPQKERVPNAFPGEPPSFPWGPLDESPRSDKGPKRQEYPWDGDMGGKVEKDQQRRESHPRESQPRESQPGHEAPTQEGLGEDKDREEIPQDDAPRL